MGEAFGSGAADVPKEYAACGQALLPQVWPFQKLANMMLSGVVEVPHCGLHGEPAPLDGKGVQELAVVLVYEHIDASGALPTETPVLSTDLTRWNVSFTDAMRVALENLRTRTKRGVAPEKRWEHHASGCGQSGWCDRFDAARTALLPILVAKRKRPDGVVDAGGHVIALATSSCVLATMSKNPMGLCFMGETWHLKIKSHELLTKNPLRLMKMKEVPGQSRGDHPLNQKAGEGMVWRWMPYAPGGPPLRSQGEFSVPVESDEVDAILNAVESGRPIPVFGRDVEDTVAKAAAAKEIFLKKKDAANAFFKGGEFVKAIAAYDAALAAQVPSDADAAIVHSNAAQALLNLAEQDEPRKQACAAEALRRAAKAVELDGANAKALARCAAACAILGETEAAAEFKGKLTNLTGGSAGNASSSTSSAPKLCPKSEGEKVKQPELGESSRGGA